MLCVSVLCVRVRALACAVAGVRAGGRASAGVRVGVRVRARAGERARAAGWSLCVCAWGPVFSLFPALGKVR